MTESDRANAQLTAKRSDPYTRLKEAILSGELAPGAPLVEGALASWLEVSRTPIREALTRLEQDGLLARDRINLLVRERTAGELLDVYDARILLETSAARFATERRTSHDVLVMRRQVRRWDNVDQTNLDALTAANREFHRTVRTASHNEALEDLLDRLDLQLNQFSAVTLSSPGRWEEAAQYQSSLVDAIEARDAEKAARISTEHFAQARQIRQQIWEEED